MADKNIYTVVVADDEDGAVVAGDKAAQPLDTLEIQVVGGLVQQQHVGAGEHHP